VLARQDQDGAFRHGEWTEQMESHFRLHASAMHLMLDALEEWRDARVLDGVRRAAAFLAKQHDIVDDGIWFLHDELERSEQAMKHSPYRWIASRMFGKAASNMLVLNTHLDTTIVLDRYAQGTRDRQFQSLTDAARAVTRKIMSLRPAEALYRVLFRTIRPTFLPKAQQQALPLPLRALKRIGTEHVIPRLNSVKARFPRLVMPGGYIDRAMSLRSWSFHYHTINVMDLLRHRRRFGAETFGPVVEEALAFTRGSGILERWAELRYEKYALGFWAESLYHLCMLDPGEEYRRWLAESVVALEHAALGLPPSLLGSNAEAVRPGAQVACPSPRDARLRTVNLSREGRLEFLVVNPSNEPIRLSWDVAPTRALAWRGRSGLTTGRQGEAEISPGDWLHGTADVLREETASGPAEARRGMVSVVIACYNAEKFIAEALDSVLNQTYGNLELIVVDDASIDRSREILSRYGDRVTVLEQPHQGPYHARNRGVAASRGEFIAFLDADDYWAPTCVEELCSRLIATGAALAYCGWQNVGEESGRGAEPFVPPDFEAGDKLAALLQGGSPWPIHAALLRRSVWDEVGGFDTSLPTTMDYELWLRVAATRPIARVDKVLAYYRFHGGGQISAKRWRQVLNGRLVKQRFVMAHPGLVSHLSPATLAEWIDGTLLRRGYDAFWRRDLESAYRIFRACLAAGAWTARDLRYLLPALLPERAFRALVLRADRRHGPT
jgi:glycosyltransferase involved in cell wall biosynthesis